MCPVVRRDFHSDMGCAEAVQQCPDFGLPMLHDGSEEQGKYLVEPLIWAREVHLYSAHASAPGSRTYEVQMAAVLVQLEVRVRQRFVYYYVHCLVSHHERSLEDQDSAYIDFHRDSDRA